MATSRRFQARNGLDNNSLTLIGVATPVNTTDAANKAYADTKLALTGGTLSGNLTIDGTAAAANTATVLTLRNTLDGGVGMNFTNSVSVPLASINALVTSSGAGTDDGILQFSTAVNGVNTERVRITSAGDVGIGTSSPASKLHVYGSGTTQAVLTSGDQTTTYLRFINTTNGGGYVGYTNDNLVFLTGSSERMRLDTSGNLGLGVTPSAWGATSRSLTVNAGAFFSGRTDAFRAHLGLNAYESASDVWRYSATLAASRYTQIDGQHQWHTAPSGTAGNAISFTQAMTLDANGNLLVGTTSNPGVLNTSVVVNSGASSLAGLVLQNNATGSTSTDGSHITIVGTELRIVNLENAATIFSNNGSERVRITAAGVLQLSPTGGEGGEINLLNPTGGTVGGYLDVSVANNLRLWTNNLNSTLQIGQLASTGGNIQFYTEAIERVRITNTGTVGIGTSTTSGAGLDIKNDAGGALLYAYGTTAAGGGVSILGRNINGGAGSYAQIALWNDQNPFTGFYANLAYFSSGSTIPNEMRLTQGAASSMTFWTNAVERERITQDGNRIVYQPTPTTQNGSATLTIAQLRTQIITSNVAATYTLPTGATLDTYTTNMAANTAFEVTFMAIGLGAITIALNGNTALGSLTIAAGTSGTYRFRKTAANTFTVYRL